MAGFLMGPNQQVSKLPSRGARLRQQFRNRKL